MQVQPQPAAAPTRRVLIPPGLSLGLLKDYPRGAALHSATGETMGTTWSVQLAAHPSSQFLSTLKQDLQAELDRIVSQMSTWLPASDIVRFNRAPAQSWQSLPEEFFEVLDCALTIARDTDGAYDPTVGKLVDLWGFGPHVASSSASPSTPSSRELDTARGNVGWRKVALDSATRGACQPGGVQLDFSGIAKGYAVDRLAQYLQTQGVDHYLVEVGGELRGHGCKPGGAPWWVALEWPALCVKNLTEGLVQSVLALDGIAVATSGDYRRYFEQQGRRYPHTLDPRTGYPIDNGLASVTVLHSSCMRADALATALSVLGPEAGLRYAGEHDLAALFIVRTPTGFIEHLTPTLACFLNE